MYAGGDKFKHHPLAHEEINMIFCGGTALGDDIWISSSDRVDHFLLSCGHVGPKRTIYKTNIPFNGDAKEKSIMISGINGLEKSRLIMIFSQLKPHLSFIK